ncbi:MAG: hypothetical protein R2788_16605 [Saprospiraceae bacterium]
MTANILRIRIYTLIRDIGSTIVDSSLLASTLTDSKNANYNFNLNYRFDNGKRNRLEFGWGLRLVPQRHRKQQPQLHLRWSWPLHTENDILSKEEFLMVAPTDIDIYTDESDPTNAHFERSIEHRSKVFPRFNR